MDVKFWFLEMMKIGFVATAFYHIGWLKGLKEGVDMGKKALETFKNNIINVLESIKNDPH